MKLANRLNEILAVQKRKEAKIQVNRTEGKFLPNGEKNITIGIKSGPDNIILSFSSDNFSKFTNALNTEGKTTMFGVMS